MKALYAQEVLVIAGRRLPLFVIELENEFRIAVFTAAVPPGITE